MTCDLNANYNCICFCLALCVCAVVFLRGILIVALGASGCPSIYKVSDSHSDYMALHLHCKVFVDFKAQ